MRHDAADAGAKCYQIQHQKCSGMRPFTALTGLHPNIDVALAALVAHYRMPTDAAVGLFATARSVGLLAHSLEQLGVPQVIRPRGRYVGPMPVAAQV